MIFIELFVKQFTRKISFGPEHNPVRQAHVLSVSYSRVSNLPWGARVLQGGGVTGMQVLRPQSQHPDPLPVPAPQNVTEKETRSISVYLPSGQSRLFRTTVERDYFLSGFSRTVSTINPERVWAFLNCASALFGGRLRVHRTFQIPGNTDYLTDCPPRTRRGIHRTKHRFDTLRTLQRRLERELHLPLLKPLVGSPKLCTFWQLFKQRKRFTF